MGMLRRFQVLQALEEQILDCFRNLFANFAKFSFQKHLCTPLSLAAALVTSRDQPSLTCHCPSHSG